MSKFANQLFSTLLGMDNPTMERVRPLIKGKSGPLPKIAPILKNQLNQMMQTLPSKSKRRRQRRRQRMVGPTDGGMLQGSRRDFGIVPISASGGTGATTMIMGYTSVNRGLRFGTNAPDIGFGQGLRLSVSGIFGTLGSDGSGNLQLKDAGNNVRSNYDLPFNPSRSGSLGGPLSIIAGVFERYWLRSIVISWIPSTTANVPPGIVSIAALELDVPAPLTYQQTISCDQAISFTTSNPATLVHKCTCMGPPLFIGSSNTDLVETEQVWFSVRALIESGLTLSTTFGQLVADVVVDVYGITSKAVTPPAVQMENRLYEKLRRELQDDLKIEVVEDEEKSTSTSSRPLSVRQLTNKIEVASLRK